MNLDDCELEQHVARVKSCDPRGPGEEINLKAKRRWEILRRTECYRRDWDEAFSRMVGTLKTVFIIGPEDYGEYFGFETDIHKIIKDSEIRLVDDIIKEQEKINKEIEKRRAELDKDPKKREEFFKKKFEKDWPSGKLEQEFLYSMHTIEGRKLADKYGLSVPYHYDDPLWDPNKDKMKYIFKDMEPVRMRVHKLSKYETGPDRKKIADHTPNLWDKRWLRIEIDIHSSSSLEATLNMIKSMINFYRKHCSPRDIGKKGSALNFYLDTENGKVSIYDLRDMNKRDGKSPWEIAKELYPAATEGKHYQPHHNNYNKKVRAIWGRIDSAIKRADKEIDRAKREIKPSL